MVLLYSLLLFLEGTHAGTKIKEAKSTSKMIAPLKIEAKSLEPQLKFELPFELFSKGDFLKGPKRISPDYETTKN